MSYQDEDEYVGPDTTAQNELISHFEQAMYGEDRPTILGQEIRNVQSFKDAYVLTHDDGVELRLADGTVVYLTVQVKRPYGWRGED